MFLIYRTRKLIACLPVAGLLAALLYAAGEERLQLKPKYDDSVVEVALIDPAELMQEPELPQELPPAEPEPLLEPEVAEPMVIEPPKPKPKPKPKLHVKPQPPLKPRPQLVQAAPRPQAKAPTAATAAKPVQAPAPVARIDSAALENRYAAALRGELEKHKQYPRGREASLQRPQGDVVVWLIVDRAGNVLEAGVEGKANNMLLNRAAQNSLRRMEKVSPFPGDAFAGKDRQRFTATFSYNLE